MDTITIAHFVSENGNEEYIVLLDDGEEAKDFQRGGFTLADSYNVELHTAHCLPMGYALNRE